MSDFLGDTPRLGRPWCPECEPEGDPTREVLEVTWCEPHAPGRGGEADDAALRAGIGVAHLSGGVEATAADNARWCDFIHRKARLLTGGSS